MYTRKTAPKVRDGKVQKKNRYQKTPNYWNIRQDEIQLAKIAFGEPFRAFGVRVIRG